VDKAVGNVKNAGSQLIKPLDEAPRIVSQFEFHFRLPGEALLGRGLINAQP
jgi:hypothetical protein